MVEAKNRLGAVYSRSVAKAANLLNLSISNDLALHLLVAQPKGLVPCIEGSVLSADIHRQE